MTIKEVEQELGIPRATVRFYEKQKLIHPERSKNSYRDYSDEDVAILKKIVIFRKIGLSVSEIEELLAGSITLPKAIEKNIQHLQQEIDELTGALKVSKQIQNNQEEMDNFDEGFYWAEIHREEVAGNKFLDVANDVIQFEKKVIFEQFDISDNEGNLRFGKKESILRALGLCVLCGAINYLMEERLWADFVEGFFLPFVWIIILSAFGLPLHFLGKKHPKLAKRIKTIGSIFAGVVIVLLLIIAIL